MFSFCTDPATLSDLPWMACYLTTGKHLNFYWAFGTVLLLLAITAPAALAFGFAGASAARSRFAAAQPGSARPISPSCAACRISPSSCSS